MKGRDRASVLREKSLEFRENKLGHAIVKPLQAAPNFYTLCGPLVERYKVGQVSLHIHCFTDLAGARCDSDLCIMAARSINDMDALTCMRASDLGPGSMRSNNCHQQSSMFIDVAECFEEGEGIWWAEALPISIRLQSLDLCNHILGDTIKPMPPKLVIESFRRRTDGKHVLFTGDVIRGGYQFPHQVIECGPQVLENVSYDEGNCSGDRRIDLHPKANAASLSLFLGHHYAGFSLKIPIGFCYQGLAVALDPDDFLPDRFNGGHSIARL